MKTPLPFASIDPFARETDEVLTSPVKLRTFSVACVYFKQSALSNRVWKTCWSAALIIFSSFNVQAAFFQNGFGLPSPTHTVRFSEFVPMPNSIITTQYQASGVSFFPCMFYAPTFDLEFGTPHIDPAASAGNFVQVFGGLQQFSIIFQEPVTAAAFAVQSQKGTFDVTPFLRGEALAVESHTFLGDLGPDATNNFVGVSGVTFDELRISNVNTYDHAMVLDNIQFRVSSALLSHFTFTADGTDTLGNSPPMTLNGVSFSNGSLVIPKFPEPALGLNAFATVRALSYDSLAISVDFNPSDLDYQHGTILSGGLFYRWLALEADSEGHLQLALNNYAMVFPFTNTLITTGAWHRVICSVDVTAQTITTFFDGVRLPDLALSRFQFNVVGLPVESSEKVISFINGGTGAFFSGQADNLMVFSRALTGEEILNLSSAQPPTFLVQPQTQILRRGDVAVFSAGVQSSEPVEYRWYRNGHELRGKTSSQLQLSTKRAHSAGLYTVVASNALGVVESNPAYLAILDPVKIVRQPIHRNVLEGEPVTLSVRVKGSGPFGYQWFSEDAPLHGQTTSTLTLIGGPAGQQTSYHVIVTNGVSVAMSRNILVKSVTIK